MTYFNDDVLQVRIPGLPLTVVQADGQNVQPVEVDEFQVATAETYDAIVRSLAERACTVFAEIDGPQRLRARHACAARHNGAARTDGKRSMAKHDCAACASSATAERRA